MKQAKKPDQVIWPHVLDDGPFEGEPAGKCWWKNCGKTSYWWRATDVNGPFAACEEHARDVAADAYQEGYDAWARENPNSKRRRQSGETSVVYHKTYDAARHAALQEPGLHCYRPANSEWVQCFLFLQHGQCQGLAMTEDGQVEEGVVWELEDGHLRANPGDPDDDEDAWDEPTPIETVPIPPMETWPRRDADSKEWQEFQRKYPRVPHSAGRRRRPT